MIGVVSSSRPQEAGRDLAVMMGDQDEPGTAPDLRCRVNGQARPVVPLLAAVEHDRHTGGAQGHPGIGVVTLSSIHKDI